MNAGQTGAHTNDGVPRDVSRIGPVLFSYGFRPFFLGSGLWAILAMALWLALITGRILFMESYGASNWHAHEMLFGFAPAVLAGFLLTAVPNWTGSLPLSGMPLAALFTLWCAGRIALLASDSTGVIVAAAIDGLFLPALLAVCTQPVVAARKWKDLKVLGGLLALALANGLFHIAAIGGSDTAVASRLGTAAYVVLVMIVGGRVLPAFTRNWLARSGRTDFPVPYNRFDSIALLAGVGAFSAWTLAPLHPVTAVSGLIAAVLHGIRLYRWRGWTVLPEKLLAVLHVAYAFVPLGFLAVALAASGVIGERSALHLLSVGAIACMMLAMMTRASLGHTGRALAASRPTVMSYVALVLCALLRPFGEILPEAGAAIHGISALLWIAAFSLFCLEYGPVLIRKRRTSF